MNPMGNFGPPGAFPFLGGHAVQAPPGWIDPRGGAGPIRRGGRQYSNSARTGPYDRNPRNGSGGGTGMRYGETGRLSPPPGSRRVGMASGAGRWGDGAAGAAAVGPREAVQGRSLRSYEDLDAVAGSGGGELNY